MSIATIRRIERAEAHAAEIERRLIRAEAMLDAVFMASSKTLRDALAEFYEDSGKAKGEAAEEVATG